MSRRDWLSDAHKYDCVGVVGLNVARLLGINPSRLGGDVPINAEIAIALNGSHLEKSGGCGEGSF